MVTEKALSLEINPDSLVIDEKYKSYKIKILVQFF